MDSIWLEIFKVLFCKGIGYFLIQIVDADEI